MSAASSSVLLLQKATNKRQKQMLKDAFKVGRKLTNCLMGSSSVLAEMWASVLYISRLQPISSFSFQKADKNGDGKLSYEEYWNAIKMSGIA